MFRTHLHAYRKDSRGRWCDVDISTKVESILEDPSDKQVDIYIVGRETKFVLADVEQPNGGSYGLVLGRQALLNVVAQELMFKACPELDGDLDKKISKKLHHPRYYIIDQRQHHRLGRWRGEPSALGIKPFVTIIKVLPIAPISTREVPGTQMDDKTTATVRGRRAIPKDLPGNGKIDLAATQKGLGNSTAKGTSHSTSKGQEQAKRRHTQAMDHAVDEHTEQTSHGNPPRAHSTPTKSTTKIGRSSANLVIPAITFTSGHLGVDPPSIPYGRDQAHLGIIHRHSDHQLLPLIPADSSEPSARTQNGQLHGLALTRDSPALVRASVIPSVEDRPGLIGNASPRAVRWESYSIS